MRRPYDPTTDFVLGIDPAMETSGFALNGPIQFNCNISGFIEGVENLRYKDPLEYLRTCLILPDKPRVWVLSEYPAWKGYGTDAVRASANAWFRYVGDVAGKTQVITAKVGPSTWQSKYLGVKTSGKDKQDPKPVYIAKAMILQNRKAVEENEAAATCLLDYAIQDLKLIAPILFAVKAKKVKA